MPCNLNEISEQLNGILIGDGNVVITGVGSIHAAKEGDIAFVTDKNLNKLDQCKASAFIVPETTIIEFKVPVIKVKNPRLDFIRLIEMFSEKTKSSGVLSSEAIDPSVTLGCNVQIDEFAVIKEDVSIGDHTIISAHSFIGKNVTIGTNCLIHPNVTVLHDTFIGDNVIIHSGAVIGADGLVLNGMVKNKLKSHISEMSLFLMMLKLEQTPLLIAERFIQQVLVKELKWTTLFKLAIMFKLVSTALSQVQVQLGAHQKLVIASYWLVEVR